MSREEFEKINNKMLDQVAEVFSLEIRNLESKEKRLRSLKNLKSKPSDEILSRIYKIALIKEDYETCEVLKMYMEEKGKSI